MQNPLTPGLDSCLHGETNRSLAIQLVWSITQMHARDGRVQWVASFSEWSIESMRQLAANFLKKFKGSLNSMTIYGLLCIPTSL